MNTVNVLIVTVEKQWADVETVCQVLPESLQECICEKGWSTSPWSFPAVDGEREV